MRHKKAAEMLARRQELAERDEASLQLHLRSCDGCRQLAGEYAEHDRVLVATAALEVPPGLRQSVLARAGRSVPSRRHKGQAVRLGLAAAAALFGIGFGVVHAWSPFASRPYVLNEAQAVRAAMIHTVVGSHGKLPPAVRLTARLGSFSGVDQAWLVTISGPGVSVISPADLVGEIHPTTTPLLHSETVVVDGRTGAFVETYTAAG